MENAINNKGVEMKTTAFNGTDAVALLPGKGVVQVLTLHGDQALVTNSLGGGRTVKISSLRSIVSRQGTHNHPLAAGLNLNFTCRSSGGR